MLCIPTLFIYIDFFAPILYIFLLLFLSYVCLKVIIKELVYKFLLDYISKKRIYLIKNIKYADLFLNKLNYSGYSIFSFFSLNVNNSIVSYKFNTIILVVFVLFFIM